MTAAALAIASSLLIAQTLPPFQPRDTAPHGKRTSAATIRGRVYGVESGQPVRRANVTLMPAGGMPPVPPPENGRPPVALQARTEPRNAISDAAGRFEFPAVAPGSYRLAVSPGFYNGQYLPAVYGSVSSMEPGRIIEVREGEVFEADVPLPRGGAIAGRIVDEMGEPLSRVTVQVMRLMPGTDRYRRTGGGPSMSDDLGRYRVYGLEAGDYVVSADARSVGGPPVEGETEGFVETFHPSVTQEQQASRVRLSPASDADGIDIQLIRTRTFRITGTVMDSQGRPVMRPNAQLGRKTGDGYSSTGMSVDPEGRFTIRNVVPGDYLLVVRPVFETPMAMEPGGRPPSPPPGAEYAMVPLTVVSDIDDLVVVTQPGATVKGRVVFTDGQGLSPAALRVMTQPGPRVMPIGPNPPASVGADGQFTLAGLVGPTLVRVTGLRREWAVRAVMLGSDDITDTPVEFKAGHSDHLQILVTTRAASLEGTVTDDEGKPVEQASILLFPEEKEYWRVGSPRVKTAGSMKDGKYTLHGLAGGRYYAVAVRSRWFLSPDMPPDFFEGLTKAATRVVVADDERRIVDLRLTDRTQ